MNFVKKHLISGKYIWGDSFNYVYYEIRGKIENDSWRKDGYRSGIEETIDEHLNITSIHWMKFTIRPDDPTENPITIFLYDTHPLGYYSRYLNYFPKNHEPVYLFLRKKREDYISHHPEDLGDFTICKSIMKHKGSWIFRDTFKNRLLYNIQIHLRIIGPIVGFLLVGPGSLIFPLVMDISFGLYLLFLFVLYLIYMTLTDFVELELDKPSQI